MRTTDMMEEIYLGVSSNRVRSGLTMLGIVIGIASVIAMLSIGQGAKLRIQASINSLGSNLLLVVPGVIRPGGPPVSAGRGSAQTLTNDDAKALAAVPGVRALAPELARRFQVTARGKNTNTQVVGTAPTYTNVRNFNLDQGSFFTDAQVSSRAKVAVIGPTTRDDLFGTDANPVGERIRVNGTDFTVIGVTTSKGASGFSNQDDMILVPISSMQHFLSGGQYVSSIAIEVADEGAMTVVQEDVTSLLLMRHKLTSPDEADFSVINQADIVSAASSVTDAFTALLAAIASISLLVGGIGIMNMMLTTVTERTREIGLRQAIGAEKGEILSQFLGESIMLTVMGGFVGVMLGYAAAIGVSRLMQTPTDVSWTSVALAFSVSAVIGLVFGYYPARRAAGLNPIQALRYE